MTPRMRGLTYACGVRVAESATRSRLRERGFSPGERVVVITVNAGLTPADDLPVLHPQAPVHHHVQAAVRGDPGGLVAEHPELQPERARPDRDSLPGDLRRELRAAEHVDNVRRLGQRVQRRIRAQA